MRHFPLYSIASMLAIGLLAACAPTTVSSEQENKDMQLAEQLKQKGDMEGAANIYRQLAVTDKTSVDAEIELAAIDRALGQSEDAVAVMQDAQRRQPENPVVLSKLGYALIDAGHSQDAVAVFDRLIALDPDIALSYNAKGVAFDKAGNHLAAQELYLHALKLSPNALNIQNNLAMSFILNDQFDQAITLLKKLNQQHSNNKTIRHNLALAYGLKGDNDKAMALNMIDLPPDEAKENLRFYEQYIRQRHDMKPSSAASKMQIGFSETSPEQKEALKEKSPPAPDEVKPAAGEPAEKDMSAAEQPKPVADKPAEESKPVATVTEEPAKKEADAGTGNTDTKNDDSKKDENNFVTMPQPVPMSTRLPTSSDEPKPVADKPAEESTPAPDKAESTEPAPAKKEPDAGTGNTDTKNDDSKKADDDFVTMPQPVPMSTQLPTSSDENTPSDYPAQQKR